MSNPEENESTGNNNINCFFTFSISSRQTHAYHRQSQVVKKSCWRQSWWSDWLTLLSRLYLVINLISLISLISRMLEGIWCSCYCLRLFPYHAPSSRGVTSTMLIKIEGVFTMCIEIPCLVACTSIICLRLLSDKFTNRITAFLI